jgi:hypothetical protein
MHPKLSQPVSGYHVHNGQAAWATADNRHVVRFHKNTFVSLNLKLNFDALVKSRNSPFFVIPAPHPVRHKLQPESSAFSRLRRNWIPVEDPAFIGVFTGVTTFDEAVKFGDKRRG